MRRPQNEVEAVLGGLAPSEGGLRLASPDEVLAPEADRFERTYGANAPGAEDPRETQARAFSGAST